MSDGLRTFGDEATLDNFTENTCNNCGSEIEGEPVGDTYCSEKCQEED